MEDEPPVEDKAPVENEGVAVGAATATPVDVVTRPGFWAGVRAAGATITAGVGAIVTGAIALIYPRPVDEGSDVFQETILNSEELPSLDEVNPEIHPG